MEPVEDVLIYTPDQKKFANTDSLGGFQLNLFSNNSDLILQHSSYYTLKTTSNEIRTNGSNVYMIEKTIKIDELVISASKWEQNKSEIPFEIMTLGIGDIAFNNPQTSADVLEATGQVFVQKSQLGGGSPMIRGFGANSVLIVVDGVRMNNTIFRGGNLQNIISVDPNTIENGEVIFGPGAVIYGSDALGGVIDFHTKKPQFSGGDELLFTGQAMARYSSANNEKTANVQVNIGKRNFSYLGSLSFSDFGNLRTGSIRPDAHPNFGKRPEYIVRINGQDSILRNSNENLQKFSAYKQVNTLQKLSFRIKDHIELGYTFNYSTTTDIPRYDRLIEYDGEILKNAQWYYGPQSWMMNALRFNYFKAGKLFDEVKIIAAFQNFEESRHDRRYRQTILKNRTEKVNVLSFNADFEKVFNKSQQLFYGLEYTYNHVNSSAFSEDIEDGNTANISTRYPNGGSDVHSMAVYTSYKRNFSEKVFLTTGIRYSYQSLNSKFNESNFTYNGIENRSSAINGNIGLVSKPNSDWNISGMLSTGFRAPNVDDISKVFDSEPGNVVVPNPELKPEYSYNTELSLTRYINNQIEISSVFFYSFLRDAMVRGDFSIAGRDSIIYDGELSKVQAIVNTGRANIYGFNIAFKMDISKSWSTSLNINCVNGKDLITNEPLRHTTPIFGMASILYNQNKFKGEFYIRFNGSRKFEDLPPSERNKTHLYSNDGSLAWYTLNLRLQYQISDQLGINGAIENILDHHYRTYSSGISAPGRNIVISVRGKF